MSAHQHLPRQATVCSTLADHALTVRPQASTSTMLRLILILVCYVVIRQVVAWGPLYEPLKGGFGLRTTLLKSAERDEDHEVMQFFRATLERTYSLEFPQADRDVRSRVPNEMIFTESFLIDESVEGNSFAYDEGESHYEDDCIIPDEFKSFSGDDAADVLSFLGIRRVEPIRVNGRTCDWE